MRVVVDTNVFVSATLKSGTPPFDVVYWIDANGGLLKSAATEWEVISVLRRPRLRAIAASSFLPDLRRMLERAELIEITQRLASCRDAKDDKFLELAVNGRADVIVSGDADLLVLNPFRGIPIETPTEFLRRLGG